MTGRRRTDPPVAASHFVGRHAEQDQILSLLLGSARLITLTGLGGIGKTQLAAEIVRRYHKAGSVPAYWVRLARLPRSSDHSMVLDEIAHSVVVGDLSATSAFDAVVDVLSRRGKTGRRSRTVLVLDNCEHVIAGAGKIIAELLSAVPSLTILATSRQAFGCTEEYLVRIPPLSAEDALALFVHRAEALGRPVRNADQISAAAEICRHMQNTPLFIRLAAARLLRRPLGAIVRELDGRNSPDKRMDWLYSGAAADSRHRGIGDAIAWSYDLCGDRERLLFERMSIFSVGTVLGSADDGFDVGVELEAIESVCSDEPDRGESAEPDASARLLRSEIQDLLHLLVDRSLVSVHIQDTTVRYSLLECLHVYARLRWAERSPEADEITRLAKRHLRYYHDTLEEVATNWVGPQEASSFAWTRAAWPNILTAIRSGLAMPGASTVVLEMCVALHSLPIPSVMSSLRELRLWTERALAADNLFTFEQTTLQVTATALLAADAVQQGIRDDAERFLDACFAACHLGPDDRQTTAEVDAPLPPAVEFAWGLELWLSRKDVRAVTVLARAHEKYLRERKFGFATQCDVSAAGAAAALLGASPRADETIRQLADRARTSGSQWTMMWADVAAALASVERGDGSAAMDLLEKEPAHRLSIGNQVGMIALLRVWALAQCITATPTDSDRAELAGVATQIAYVVGGIHALRDELGLGMQALTDFADRTAHAIGLARGLLGDKAFEVAFDRGSQIDADFQAAWQLVGGAPDTSGQQASADAPYDDAPWSQLSRSEQHVALLAAAGLTNTAIATRRGTSMRTVDAQLAAVFQKLMVGSRHDIVDFIPHQRMDEVETEAMRWIRSRERRQADLRSDQP
ncbi:LuxR C-terminal-related transcriptional regulator [Nocardia sp. NPDC050630]|uniref:LuxR C-terminal-related transcriptional regulator n=1 Tax=Nocardia sp. NPDC050630 TaxID=3364321 RepID=UPI00379A7E50